MGTFSGLRRLNGRPLMNPDGTVSVFCRKCGREICRRTDQRMTSISECLVCQGYNEKDVTAQYVQSSPLQPIMPKDADAEYLFLYGDPTETKPGERVGTPMTMFRAFGIVKTRAKKMVESAKVAIRKRRKGLFEPVDEE